MNYTSLLGKDPARHDRPASSNVDAVLRSPGQPLDSATRQCMEDRFALDFSRVSVHTGSQPISRSGLNVSPALDESEQEAEKVEGVTSTSQPLSLNKGVPSARHDFSQVRVHTDGQAAESARALNALAYTSGQHIAFNSGQYAPATAAGRRLIAHELTHVVQQAASGHDLLVQRKAIAIRFQDEPTLDDVSEGKKVLKEKDTGEAVIRITTALAELGHYTNIIDENFDPPLTSAVQKYQAAKGLKGKAIDGEVDKPTFGQLDKDFSSSYQVERNVLSNQKKPDLLKGTQSLDAAERAASSRAISTEIKPGPGGVLPKFQHLIPGKGEYEDRLRVVVEDQIVAEFNALGKGKAALHADPKNLYTAPTIDNLAKAASDATDNVFGEYTKGAALQLGVNVLDAWTHKVNELSAGGKAAEDDAVDWRVTKILTGSPRVATLNEEHGAIESRPDEKVIVDKIKAEMITKHRSELLETHKGWPGFEDQGKVFMQLFKGKDANAQKLDMWKNFQTLIHEYIHSLENHDHITFRETMTEQKGQKTLREGTTDYFTKIVWNSLHFDDAFRKKIEGPLNDPAKPFPIPPLHTYPESANAERLAGIVGLRNLAAAFFLGKVELIGKT
jgi:peptidoglycan hydrolase-like protein with peptidoglycan-binding domain